MLKEPNFAFTANRISETTQLLFICGNHIVAFLKPHRPKRIEQFLGDDRNCPLRIGAFVKQGSISSPHFQVVQHRPPGRLNQNGVQLFFLAISGRFENLMCTAADQSRRKSYIGTERILVFKALQIPQFRLQHHRRIANPTIPPATSPPYETRRPVCSADVPGFYHVSNASGIDVRRESHAVFLL